ITRLWATCVGLYRALEATPWGGLVLGNAWPAYLFALPLSARVWSLAHAAPPESAHAQAQLLQEVVTVAFLALVVILFAIRRRAIAGQRASWQGGAVALVGTFLLNAVAYLPIDDTTSTASLLSSSVVVIIGTL